MIFPFVAGGLAIAKGISSFFGRRKEAERQREMLEAEQRQRILNAKRDIGITSSSSAGSVETNNLNTSYLNAYSTGSGSEYVKDASFAGSMLGSLGDFLGTKSGETWANALFKGKGFGIGTIGGINEFSSSNVSSGGVLPATPAPISPVKRPSSPSIFPPFWGRY